MLILLLQSMKYFIPLILLSALFAQSCKKNVVETPKDLSSDYHAMKTGDWWLYQMDSIKFYGTGASPDTFKYQVRHRITDDQTSADGNTSFSIEIEHRKDTNYQWQFARAYSVRIDELEVIRKDFDIDELVLSKPFSVNKVWDGNQFNAQPRSTFYISSLHIPQEVNGINYDSTVTILQEEQINLVNSYQGKEVYAKGVGMILREKEYLSNLTDPNKVTGYKYILSLLEFAK